MSKPRKEYLGDGAYVEAMSDSDILVTTSDGISTRDQVCLDTHCISALFRFCGFDIRADEIGKKLALENKLANPTVTDLCDALEKA